MDGGGTKRFFVTQHARLDLVAFFLACIQYTAWIPTTTVINKGLEDEAEGVVVAEEEVAAAGEAEADEEVAAVAHIEVEDEEFATRATTTTARDVPKTTTTTRDPEVVAIDMHMQPPLQLLPSELLLLSTLLLLVRNLNRQRSKMATREPTLIPCRKRHALDLPSN